MRATTQLVAADRPDRLVGVRVSGVDKHRWVPRRIGPEGLVTLIIDLTPTHDQTGAAWLLDLVLGRSAAAMAAQPVAFAVGMEVVAMEPDAPATKPPQRTRPARL